MRETSSASSEGPRGRRRIVVALLLAALAIIVAFVLFPGRRAARPLPTAGVQAPAAPAPPAPVTAESSMAPVPRPLASAPPEPPPIIDDIEVEKPEVCSGEENLVTVRAHTPNGTDEFLHSLVDGKMGSSVPVRLWLGDDGNVQGRHLVQVFGRNNAATTAPLPSYKVKNCQPLRTVLVEAHLRANTWGEFDLVAKVVTLPPPPAAIRPDAGADVFVPASYVWSFGDGEAATSSGPLVTHSYEGRAQSTLYSYFTVIAEARAKSSEKLTGRTTLALINPAFEAFTQKGIVALLAALEPRFPAVGADGRVVQRVRLWHTRPDPVTIEEVTLTKYFEAASGQTKPQAVDAAALLGTTTIPPGKEGITTTVVLDTERETEVFSATYRLRGTSRDGHPVMGSFSVMRPPRRPTAQKSRIVGDPTLKAKIVAARQILGKDVVNDEDIWQLERDGLLAVPNAVAASPFSSAAPSSRAAPSWAPPGAFEPRVTTRAPPVPTSLTAPPTATVAPGGLPPKTK